MFEVLVLVLVLLLALCPFSFPPRISIRFALDVLKRNKEEPFCCDDDDEEVGKGGN